MEINQLYLLDKIQSKKSSCGTLSREFINAQTGESKLFPVYCDNRSCTNPCCKEHRGYKYSKHHAGQIFALSESIISPKAWVFTGWVLPLSDLTREFIQSKMLKLVKLLRQFSTTEFSVHMEIKIKSDNLAYLHFHAVSGSIDKLGLVRKLWGRQIKYETALTQSGLSKYISKYASKCPTYFSQSDEDHYTLLVYKTQMHRFSPKASKCQTTTLWYDAEQLKREMISALLCSRGCSFGPNIRHDQWRYSNFIPYLDHPPPDDSDVPACVYVYPTRPVKFKYKSSQCSKNQKLDDFSIQTTLEVSS